MVGDWVVSAWIVSLGVGFFGGSDVRKIGSGSDISWGLSRMDVLLG